MDIRICVKWAPLILALIAPVIVTDPYHRHLLVLSGIFAILALSLDIPMGYLGELPLGHASFFGLGAYCSALLDVNFHLPFWVTLPAAGLFAGIMGFLIGLPSFRVRGPYFAIVTLGFAVIVQLIVTNWISLTRGPMGITKISPPSFNLPYLHNLHFSSEFSYFYLVLATILFSIYLTRKLIHCRTGRAILAIRENETLALSIGVEVYYFKVLAFSLGTMLAGIAGSLYAHYFRVVTPDLVGLYYITIAIIMLIVGGTGSIGGAILGALIFTILPETLRVAQQLRLVIFGVILLISIIYLPQGVVRGLERLSVRIFNRNLL